MRLKSVGLGLLAVVVACGDDGVPIGGSTSDSTGAEPTTSGMVPTSSSTTPATDTAPATTSTSSTTEEPDDTTQGGSEATSLTASDSSTTDSTGTIVTETTSNATTDVTTLGEVTSDSMTFMMEPDLGPAAECSVWDQDCPEGEKCNAWANDGGVVWNAWRCVPLDVAPVELGEECAVEGSSVSGIDNCALGQTCWAVDPETNLGTCVGYCAGSEDSPTCVDDTASCIFVVEPWLPLCLPNCDPFTQDCDAGDGCYGIGVPFACVPDASGEMGEYFDPCEYVNACDPGLHCASVDNLPGCAESMCCTPWCDLDGFDCPDDLDCVPYHAPGQAPPGYEDVGFCGVPT